jgi:hypothetical protein
VFLFCFVLLFCFWWGWGLNSRLHVYKAGALPLELYLQPIFLWLVWRWSLENYFPGLFLNCDPTDLSFPPNLEWQALAIVPSYWLKWGLKNFFPWVGFEPIISPHPSTKKLNIIGVSHQCPVRIVLLSSQNINLHHDPEVRSNWTTMGACQQRVHRKGQKLCPPYSWALQPSTHIRGGICPLP